MPKPETKITAATIKELLETKHSKDTVVHEAPIGPGGSGQIDTWVMRNSWTNASVIGYEIKVSRSDFLNDHKWPKYLDCCNEFYFVVAPGVCDKREIPDGVGLMVVATTGTRLFTKIKAKRRTEDVEGIEDVMRSVLMNRADIRISRNYGPRNTREHRMAQWNEDIKRRGMLGYRVSKAIQEEWRKLRAEARQATDAVKRYDSFKKTLIEHGFDPDAMTWDFRSKLRTALGIDLAGAVDRSITTLELIREELASGQKGPTDETI